MKKLPAVLVAIAIGLTGATALAADPPKADAAKAVAALKKPANVTQEAWDKMSDADKKKAVDAATKAGSTTAAAPAKKEKKGGC